MGDADAPVVEEFNLEAGGAAGADETHGVVVKDMALLPCGGDALVVDGAARAGIQVGAEAGDAGRADDKMRLLRAVEVVAVVIRGGKKYIAVGRDFERVVTHAEKREGRGESLVPVAVVRVSAVHRCFVVGAEAGGAGGEGGDGGGLGGVGAAGGSEGDRQVIEVEKAGADIIAERFCEVIHCVVVGDVDGGNGGGSERVSGLRLEGERGGFPGFFGGVVKGGEG